MKKIVYSLLVLMITGFLWSCTDTSLDPLQFEKVKKGTILALRGTQLDNIYRDGLPGAEFFPRIIDGTEQFVFDAEILAEDPSTLESFDIYVIKRDGSTKERMFIKNVPASDFKKTDDYLRPWVTVTLQLTDMLDLLGLDYTDPADVDILLTTYKFGLNIESDLNLKGGEIVYAADIVATGLFQSDQFYPAQVLTYSVTDFCVYDAPTWATTYEATEVYSNSAYGPYDVTFTQDPGNPNKFIFTNFWDSGITAYILFTPATNDPANQIVTFPSQDDGSGVTISGTGTYDQCLQKFSINTEYDGYTWRYEFKKK